MDKDQKKFLELMEKLKEEGLSEESIKKSMDEFDELIKKLDLPNMDDLFGNISLDDVIDLDAQKDIDDIVSKYFDESVDKNDKEKIANKTARTIKN